MDIGDSVLTKRFKKLPLGSIDYILLAEKSRGKIVARGFRQDTWMVRIVTDFQMSLVIQVPEDELEVLNEKAAVFSHTRVKPSLKCR